MSEIDTKECRKCGEVKELTTDYYPRNSKSKDGFDGRCKACWKIIQQEKRQRKQNGGGSSATEQKADNARKVVERVKKQNDGGSIKKQYAYSKKDRPSIEFAPPDLKVHSLARYADLPSKEDGAEFMEWKGTLEEGLQWFQVKYGRMPDAIYVPAQFFLQVEPSQPSSEKE